MTDTAQTEDEVVEYRPPMLDIDAMLDTLHNELQVDDPEESGVKPEDDENFGLSKPYGTPEGVVDTEEVPEGDAGQADPDLLPPGYVRVGEEVLSETEARALLELNRRVKDDPDTATRVRNALLGQQPTQEQAPDPDALPAWLDPDDQQAVFQYRQTQRIDAELQEIKRNEAQRVQQQALSQEEARRVEVIDAFRGSMKEFRDDHPTFGPEDLKVITDRAASMGLLESPEKVGGTLRAGIVTALDTAMWSMPEYRERAASGATVPTKEQKSATRKQKSSALSSSTGSVVRTQSQEPTPTTRKEVVAGALDFLRSGQVAD